MSSHGREKAIEPTSLGPEASLTQRCISALLTQLLHRQRLPGSQYVKMIVMTLTVLTAPGSGPTHLKNSQNDSF